MCYLPEVLVFHIKRFDGNGKKINRFIEYPKEIDMRPFLTKSESNNVADLAEFESRYYLFGLTEHSGQTNG